MENSKGKSRETLGSSKQIRIRLTKRDIKGADIFSKNANNGHATVIMKNPDFAQDLVKCNLYLMESRTRK